MVECRECGARNSESSTFCVRCGVAIAGDTPRAEAAPGSDTDRLDPVQPEDSTPEVEPVIVADEPAAVGPEALLARAADLMGEGRPDDAAAQCREAIGLAPDMVAAYSMLGMAEEQRGNTIAAAGAYRRVLQLDPGRAAEREKLELLYAADESHEPAPQRGGKSGVSWLERWAPAVIGLAAAFLVMMVLAGIIYRVHGMRVAERTYSESMAAGEARLQQRDYQAAVTAFEAALAARPGDRDAEQGRGYAQRKLAATRSASASAPTGSAAPRQALAPILPSRGPNAFLPIPIGPQRATNQPDPREQPQTTRPARATPPPRVNTDPVVGTTRAPATTGDGAIEFQNPLDDPGDRPPTTTTPADAPDYTASSEAPPKRGEINIWVSEEPAPPRGASTGSGGATSSAAQASRAAGLRDQADQLRAGGRCEAAAETYDQAIDAYRAESEANPGIQAANEAAIKACERARGICQSGQGQ